MKAIKNYKKAVNIRPRADTYYLLGTAFHELGKAGQAVSAYEKALKLDPRHYEATHNLGVLYHNAGQKEKGEYYLNKAKKLK